MEQAMIDLNLIRIFCKVSELGSFTQAARYFKAPKSRISRAITSLEDELGVQLLLRTTRQIQLTKAGEALFEKTKVLIFQLQSELDDIQSEEDNMSGVIRITAAEDFGHNIVAPLILKFNELYPNIIFECLFTNRFVDLVADKIDVAFRIGQASDSSYKQKRLGQVSLVLMASPNYLKTYGRPKSFHDLKDHRLITFKNEQGVDVFADMMESKAKGSALTASLYTNSFLQILSYTKSDMGIGILPDFFCIKERINKDLEQVLTPIDKTPSPINLVFPPSKNLPKRVREFMDFVFENTRNSFCVK